MLFGVSFAFSRSHNSVLTIDTLYDGEDSSNATESKL